MNQLNGTKAMCAYIEKICGVQIEERKLYLLETRLTPILVKEGLEDFSSLLIRLQSSGSEKLRSHVVDAMTTNETLWFRDKGPWSLLKDHFLPKWVLEIKEGKRHRVRIWSAACSTGQEPYSVSIAIEEFIRSETLLPRTTFEILATDISSAAIAAARSGRFMNMAIRRGLDNEMRERYFDNKNNAWVVKDRVKNRVKFEQANLRERDVRWGKFDLIMCRNVLIYFSEDTKRAVCRHLVAGLEDDGALIVGASESLIVTAPFLDRCAHGPDFYYVAGNKS